MKKSTRLMRVLWRRFLRSGGREKLVKGTPYGMSEKFYREQITLTQGLDDRGFCRVWRGPGKGYASSRRQEGTV